MNARLLPCPALAASFLAGSPPAGAETETETIEALQRRVATLEETDSTCNACHEAAGSPFIRVTLDAPDALDMRHPHDLEPQRAPRGHTHSH